MSLKGKITSVFSAFLIVSIVVIQSNIVVSSYDLSSRRVIELRFINLIKSSGLPVSIEPDTYRLVPAAGSSVDMTTKGLSIRILGAFQKPGGVLLRDTSVIEERGADTVLYYMYNHVYASPEDKTAFEEARLQYNITIMPPQMLGDEYIKTSGHFHGSVKSPEGKTYTYVDIYEVLQGKAVVLLQHHQGGGTSGPVDEVIAIHAKAGDKVIIPPNYAHVLINVGDTDLITADLASRDNESIYKVIESNNGAAYYLIKNEDGEPEFVLNDKYAAEGEVPGIIECEASDLPSRFLLGVNAPSYTAVASDLGSIDFINQPWKRFTTNGDLVINVKALAEVAQSPIQLGLFLVKKPWGGNWIAEDLKNLSEDELATLGLKPGMAIGESWEVSAWPGSTSNIGADGGGISVNLLTKLYPEQVLGERVVAQFGFTLPTLVKFLDCNQFLSIQSHPMEKDSADGHKTEAWVVLDAEEGAKIYLGFRDDIGEITEDRLRRYYERLEATGIAFEDSSSGRQLTNPEALAAQEAILQEFINVIPVKKGDVVLVPEGSIHALGPGIKVAEIQLTSGITYRMFDWNAASSSGETRELHKDQMIATVNKEGHPVSDFLSAEGIFDNDTLGVTPLMPDSVFQRFGLESSSFFTFDMVVADSSGVKLDTGGMEEGCFNILTVIEGDMILEVARQDNIVIRQGNSILLPASLGAYRIVSQGENVRVINSYVPKFVGFFHFI